MKSPKTVNDLCYVCSTFGSYGIHASLELWPTLVGICYFHKDKKDFPQLRVKNKKLKNRNGSSNGAG